MIKPSLRANALAALLCTALLHGAALSADDKGAASRYYEDAQKRYLQHDYDGAAIQLRNALKIDKKQLAVHLLLGKVLLGAGDVANAEFEFDESLRLGVNRVEVALPLAQTFVAQGRQEQVFSDSRVALDGLPTETQYQMLLLRASAQLDLGRTDAALAELQNARATMPTDAAAWIAEVPVRVRRAQFREAQAAVEQALRLSPGNADALYQQATILHTRGQLDGALGGYGAALKADPGHLEARVARAGLLLDLGRDKEAGADLDELNHLEPLDPRANYLRAVLAQRQGNMDDAKDYFHAVTEFLDPVPLEYLRYRVQLLIVEGLSHYGLSEFEKAKPYLDMAWRQQPDSPLAKLLAQIALRNKDAGSAVDLLDTYVKGHPGDGQALLMLASVHLQQGRYSKATALMQQALQAKDAPGYHTVLGLSLVRDGRTDQGMAQLEQAFKTDPKQAYAGLTLVTQYLQTGQPAKALGVANTMAKASPDNAAVLVVLGQTKAVNGDTAGARAAYERAAKLAPSLNQAQYGLAEMEMRTHDFAAAEKRLRTLLKANDRNPDLLIQLAALYELWGKDAQAQQFLESAADASDATQTRADSALVAWRLKHATPAKALEAAKVLLGKTPDDVSALQTYAGVQVAAGDVTGARSTLTQAARRAGFDPANLTAIAGIQLRIGDAAGAAYSLDKALQGRPGDMPAQILMAHAELMQGHPEQAEQRAQVVLKAYPRGAAGYDLLADIALSRNQPREAIDALRKAHAAENSTRTLMRLFDALARQPDGKPAIDLAQGWLRTHPKDAVVINALGSALARAGSLPQARHQYEAAIALNPDDAEALNNLANILLAQKDPGALQVAEKALAKAPGNALVIDTVGWASLQAGQRDRAVQLLRDARLRAPTNPEIRFHLASALAAIGQKVEARQELAVALQGAGTSPWGDQARVLQASLK